MGTLLLKSVRSFTTTTVLRKQDDLLSNLFLKQIRELAAKQKAAGGSLINTSPELKKQLDEQLNRLAQKFKLSNSEVVSKLAVEFEKPHLESSVSAVTEKRSLDDFINEVKESQTAYEKEHAAKKQEEQRRQKIASA